MLVPVVMIIGAVLLLFGFVAVIGFDSNRQPNKVALGCLMMIIGGVSLFGAVVTGAWVLLSKLVGG